MSIRTVKIEIDSDFQREKKECISLEQFYECLKSKMEKYRGISDIKTIQEVHRKAEIECANKNPSLD